MARDGSASNGWARSASSVAGCFSMWPRSAADRWQIGSAIRPHDLEAAERLHDVEGGLGDVVFVRNGGGARNTYQRGTGLHASCLPWLHERGVAVLSSDSDSDVHPPLPASRAGPSRCTWS